MVTQLDNARRQFGNMVERADHLGVLPSAWREKAVLQMAGQIEEETGMGYRYTGDPEDLRMALEDKASDEAAAEAEDEEIELVGQDKIISLRLPSKELLILTVPPMTLGRLEMLNRFQHEAEKTEQQLLATSLEDMRGVERRAQRSKKAKMDLLRFAIPGFPMEHYDNMPARSFSKMMDTINEMKEEAMGGRRTRPNS